MKTGWVISVTDLQANDKAFKCYLQNREAVAKKVETLSSTVEEDKFKILISSPHVEVDIEKRMAIKCQLSEEHSAALAFAELHDLNPFLFRVEGSEALFEIDKVSELPQNYQLASY